MQHQRLSCPVCGQMDRVRNVSVIVNEQKALAQRRQTGEAVSGALGAFGKALGSIAAITSVFGGARFLVISRRRSRSQSTTPEMLLRERLAFPSHPISGLLDAFSQPLLLVLGLVIGLIVAGLFVMKISITTMLADPLWQKVILVGGIGVGILLLFAALRIRIAIKDRPRRERAYAVWQDLSYCSRDDVVFLSQIPGRWVPADQMRKLLRY